STGPTNNMVLMADYDSETPNFEQEPDRVFKHITTYHRDGVWDNLDMGQGATSHTLNVEVPGTATGGIEGSLKALQQKLLQVPGLTKVKWDLTEPKKQHEV
ncbi:hypothetical protein, partial [Staphylococcus pseudintermedius]|uniref:hypothetical protein n=1 Tax=Staphylococcus pseudintermedius TaxID=283734 RepID=UPI000E39AC5A